MRKYIQANDRTLPGWLRRRIKKPTAFMMTTKFSSGMLVTSGGLRQLTKLQKPIQLKYLKALAVTPDDFISP
jgi:hypothetical protein